jgi:hypothetical protein
VVAQSVVAQPSFAHFAAGMVALLAITAALTFAARRIRQKLVPALDGATGMLATLIVALALLVALLELLGALSLFETLPVLICALLIAAVTALRCPAVGRRDPQQDDKRTAAWIAIPLGALLALWLAPTLASYDHGIRELDSLWYHLPWAADFARSHSTTRLNFTDVEYLTTFYPATAELFHGLGIAVLGADTLSPFINLGWLAAALLAAWCVGARRGLGPATMLGAAIVLATPMTRSSQPGTADNDVVATFFVLAAAALLPEDLEPGWQLALAAVAAGLAVGTKLTAVPAVIALTLGVIVAAGPEAGDRRRRTLSWLVPLIVAGGYWYVRNWIAIGTPFPWVRIPGLPLPALPLQANSDLSVAHYLGNSHFLTSKVPQALRTGFGTAWPALLIVLVAGPLAGLVLRGRKANGMPALWAGDRRLRTLAFTALAAAAAYLVTPESAPGPPGHPIGFAYNLRYVTPALALALAVTPLAAPLQGRHAKAATIAAGVVLLGLTLASAGQWPGASGRVLAAVGIAVAALALLALSWRHPRPVLAAAAIAAIAGGYAVQRDYLKHRYMYAPGVSDLARVWADFRNVSGARVAVSGTFGQFFAYPLYGLRSTNTVQYLGHRGPHGSFTPIRSCTEFVATLNAGHYDYLVSTPDRNVWRPQPLSRSPASAWVAPGPTARVVYRRSATGQPLTVWRLTGPLPTSTCAHAGAR